MSRRSVDTLIGIGVGLLLLLMLFTAAAATSARSRGLATASALNAHASTAGEEALPAEAEPTPTADAPTTPTPAPTLTPTPAFTFPELVRVRPQPATRGSTLTVVGRGGLPTGEHGNGAAFVEFPLWLDEQEVGVLSCYAGACTASLALPPDIAPGTHTLRVEGGATLTFDITTATPTPTPTPPPPTPTPIPTPQATLHFWLERPIPASATNTVARFYPYGSTGEGQYAPHHGVEFVNPLGTPILAPADGTIVFAGSDDTIAVGPTTHFYGNVVVMQLDRQWKGQPVYVLFRHMNEIAVQTGQRVQTGDLLGTVGASGIALGPHLHLEVRVGQNFYDAVRNPQLWLKPLPGHGVLVGQVLTADGEPAREALVTVLPLDEDRVAFYEYTYASDETPPDDEWQENLLIGDIPAGTWRVFADIEGSVVMQIVTIEDGGVGFVRLQAPPRENNP
ncbi:MAG: M23 family metallopeptidase [Ardenticatenia bacterium]|nr:MAG: M23 family metallopeptidase [Ardenticatenia bacterium]